jgi:transcription elongation factor GreA
MHRIDIRLTDQGRHELEAELERLVAELPSAGERIGAARATGSDPAENLDLRDALDDLALLESRVAELRATLAIAEPVRSDGAADGVASLGRTAKVRFGDGEEAAYTLVSPVEADPRRGRISIDSPVGRALVGHRMGEELSAETPSGIERLLLLDVQ